MTLAALALILTAGLVGPALASWRNGNLPVAVGELLIGVALGPTGIDVVPVHDPLLGLLATIGFALVMLVVGSHLNVQALADRTVTRRAATIVLVALGIAIPLALVISAATGFHEAPLFALLLTSSSAAIVLPILHRLDHALDTRVLIACVTIADVACIVGLPLVMHSGDPVETGSVALIIALLALVVFAVLQRADRKGDLNRFRSFSKAHEFGLELRLSLIIVISLAAFASRYHVTVMFAGFSIGLALAAVGVPHRLARQLFAVTEGFFAPVFFVMLGTSIDVRHTFSDAHAIGLAVSLAAGTVLVHLSGRWFGLPTEQALISGAQLGVPIAAVTIGRAAGTLSNTESSAILSAALVSILVAVAAANALQRPKAHSATAPH